MKVQIRDKEALESLTVANLRAYLEKHGWGNERPWGTWATILSKEGSGRLWEVSVPNEVGGLLYAESVAEIIATLAEAEDRSQLDVFNDLGGMDPGKMVQPNRKGGNGMVKPGLGRLERVELREVWTTEDQDFTPWLAQETNLAVLSETLNMELVAEGIEQGVGPFRADILCRDTMDDSWVLIENQLKRTDHTHLGQLLTYAAGLQTVTIIWVAATFTDEHRAALDWLNEITDERFRFFGLEIELWQIGDSPAAPKFNVVSKPNEWTRSVSKASRHRRFTDLTDTQPRYRPDAPGRYRPSAKWRSYFGIGNQRVSDIFGAVRRMALGEAYGQFAKTAGVSQEMADYIIAMADAYRRTADTLDKFDGSIPRTGQKA